MKTIKYAIDTYTGLVYSQVGNLIAIPILDYENMKPENNFQTIYYLEKFAAFEAYKGTNLKWTRKISNDIKNFHRKFWGFKPLKGKNRWEKAK